MDIQITRQGSGAHRAGHVWELRVDGVYAGVFETRKQAEQSAADLVRNSDAFARDLDEITGGYSASHYLDDDNFDDAVSQMQYLGHDSEKTVDFLRKWINETPMWECPECGKDGLDEATYGECPICGSANPGVVWSK